MLIQMYLRLMSEYTHLCMLSLKAVHFMLQVITLSLQRLTLLSFHLNISRGLTLDNLKLQDKIET